MIYNLQSKYYQNLFFDETERLAELGHVVELKVLKNTRTIRQNRALHLFFEQVANELNRLGIAFVYRGIKGMEMETRWTAEIFKQFTWKPLQKTMFGTESTTELKTNQIDPIIEVINKFFAEMGVEITFPNQFDYYLKFYSDKNGQ